jgi:hypothetical protein
MPRVACPEGTIPGDVSANREAELRTRVMRRRTMAKALHIRTYS